MFRIAGQWIGQHIGRPLWKLGTRIIPDRTRRKRSWLYLRKAVGLWVGRDKSTVWLYVDQPNIYTPEPLEVESPKVFRGWALSERGIATVSFACDGALLGEASLGISRPDVAVLASHVKQSSRCGFYYLLDPRGITAGLHELTVTAESYDGSCTRSSCSIDVIYSPDDYALWRKNQAASAATLAWMQRHVDKLLDQPLVSFFLKLSCETEGSALEHTIHSLRDQVYPHWELCIACDKPAYERVAEVLSRISAEEPRLRLHVEPFALTGGAPRFPAEQIRGEFLGTIDAGDTLEPQALFEVVYLVNRSPEIDFAYTDEDVFVAPGVRDDPILKPDWPGQLNDRSGNIGRLWLARRRIAVEAGELEAVLNGGTEAEACVRLAQRARKVGHVNAVLYTRSRLRELCGAPALKQAHYSARKEVSHVVTCAPFPIMDLARIQRILLVMLDHLGDALLTFPAIERLRQLFPHAQVTALVGSWSESLAHGNRCIDEVLTYDFFDASSSEPYRELDRAEERRIEHWLSAFGFDLAVDFRREPETRSFLRWSRARYTVGFIRGKDDDWLTVAVPYEPNVQRHKPRRHVAQELVHLVEMIPIAGRVEICPRVEVPADEQANVYEMLRSLLPPDNRLLVAIHPGSGRSIKCWPPEYFARLADLLVERLGARIVWFGASGEIALVNEIRDRTSRDSESFSLAGRLTIPQMLAALGHFDLFVGNDSGPTHLAAGTGMATLCVCSGTIDPMQWGPIGPAALVIYRPMKCSPCYVRDREECPFDVACLRDLPVTAVYDAVVRTLLPQWGKLTGTPAFSAHSPDRGESKRVPGASAESVHLDPCRVKLL